VTEVNKKKQIGIQQLLGNIKNTLKSQKIQEKNKSKKYE